MTIVMRPSCWQNFGPNGLVVCPYPKAKFKLLFLFFTTDFNISSALMWAIQDQWSSGLNLFLKYFMIILCKWATPWENLSYVICEEQRRRSTSRKCYSKNTKTLGSDCSWAGPFESFLVGNHWRQVFLWWGSNIFYLLLYSVRDTRWFYMCHIWFTGGEGVIFIA